jgi:hypothetical protein
VFKFVVSVHEVPFQISTEFIEALGGDPPGNAPPVPIADVVVPVAIISCLPSLTLAISVHEVPFQFSTFAVEFPDILRAAVDIPQPPCDEVAVLISATSVQLAPFQSSTVLLTPPGTAPPKAMTAV